MMHKKIYFIFGIPCMVVAVVGCAPTVSEVCNEQSGYINPVERVNIEGIPDKPNIMDGDESSFKRVPYATGGHLVN